MIQYLSGHLLTMLKDVPALRELRVIIDDTDLVNMILPESSHGSISVNGEVKQPEIPKAKKNLLLKSTEVPSASIVNPVSPVLPPPKRTAELRTTLVDANYMQDTMSSKASTDCTDHEENALSPKLQHTTTTKTMNKRRSVRSTYSMKRKLITFKKRKSTSDKTAKGYISMFIPRPPMPLGSNYHKKQFIVNEVLCYIQNKMDSKAKEVIVNLAS